MKYLSVYTLVLILFFVGCSANKSKNSEESIGAKVEIQHFHLPQSGENILRASYFADTVVYIPLETRKESLIKGIKQLWMNDSYILVNCWQNGLLLFQSDGRFVRRIGKQGKGPGEYLSIYHFDVVRDTIYVSSTGRRGFLRYTFDGSFIDEIKLNYEPIYFTSTGDEKVACYIHQEGIVLLYNQNFLSPDTIIVEHGVTQGRYNYVTLSPFMTYLQKTEKDLLFNSYLNDTVWNISDDKKDPAYILDLKNELLPYDKQIEFSNGDFTSWEKMVKSFHFVHLIPFTSSVFIFQLPWYTTKYDAIYLGNLQTGEIKKYDTSNIYDDISGKQRLNYINFMYTKDYLVAITDPDEVFENCEDDKAEKPSSSFTHQMKKVKEEDNPILVLMRVKKLVKSEG